MRDVQARQPSLLSAAQQEQLELRVHGAILMVDELLREIYLVGSSKMAKFATDEAAVVDALSALWFRAIYAQDDD